MLSSSSHPNGFLQPQIGKKMIKVLVDGEARSGVKMYFQTPKSNEGGYRTNQDGLVNTVAPIGVKGELYLSHGQDSHITIENFELTGAITVVLITTTGKVDKCIQSLQKK